ncbi:hypothetical protein TrLO_g3102 [Triparma laevis f. longispina]|uniref:DUF6259 domain-containing protein n=1 Tax=Triparma laevis f. longispina TaxID=1714387 RepID=A0A9W7FIG1_9STRA|nr:hypothetical protein TrLO_g3102 [Triparma laevis f. longispina]
MNSTIFTLYLLIIGIIQISASKNQTKFSLTTPSLLLQFDTSTSNVLSSIQSTDPTDPTSTRTFSNPSATLFSIEIVNATSLFTIDSKNPTATRTLTSTTPTQTTATWSYPQLSTTVSLHFTSSEPFINIVPSITFPDNINHGIATFTLSIPMNPSTEDAVFFPDSYGVESSGTNGYSGTYPSAAAAMQHMAISSSTGPGIYVAAHDKSGDWKELGYDGSTCFHVKIVPVGATKPVPTWSAEYSVSIAALPKITDSNPLYKSASELYREFIFEEPAAEWLRRGMIKNRLPDHLKNSHVWLNTGWQCHDVFEDVQGDPATAQGRVEDVVGLWRDLGMKTPVGLHYYEWQQGPDPDPSSRYLFDTHYPDYFPGRVSSSGTTVKQFSKTVKETLDVYTYPYINGRIFDLTCDSYIADDGESVCVKVPSSMKLFSSSNTDLSVPTENYGSGPDFCIANPATEYWQNKIGATVEELVNEYGSSGVYIDQVASASMNLCYDPSHNHTIANGHWWRNGYLGMFNKIHELVGDSTNAPMVTESNSEIYMDMVEGYLPLTAFAKPFASSSNGNILVPAFSFVYGGYYNAFGAEFYQADFTDIPYLRSKIAGMLITGTQIGWFSLGGIEDDACGEMGLYDLFMDKENLDVNQYIVDSANIRSELVDFFLNGRQYPNPVADPAPKIAGTNWEYLDVMTGTWVSEHASEVVVLLCNVADSDKQFTLTLDFTTYGWKEGDQYKMDGSDEVFTVDSGNVQVVDMDVESTGIEVLRFALVQ